MGVSRALLAGFLLLFLTVSASATDQISVDPLDLSRPVSSADLSAAGQLGGPLVATGGEDSEAANLSFGRAIQAWNSHEYDTAYGLLRGHVEQFPHSPWVAESKLHMGCESRYQGRYGEAEQHYQDILTDLKELTDPSGQKLLNKATLRLAVLKTLQNNFDAADEQFRKLYANGSDWRDRTYASHWIQRLSRYKADQLALLDCGTRALAYMLQSSGKTQAAGEILKQQPANERGHSMEELQQLAGQHGYSPQGLQLAPGDLGRAPLPLIAQIQGRQPGDRGHYWIVEKLDGDQIALHDPQSHRRFSQTLDQFSREWSGAALVFVPDESASQSLPGRRLAQTELSALTGGCCGLPRPEANLGKDCNATDASAQRNAGSNCSGSAPGGEPFWRVNLVSMNFYLHDTPLWYQPSVGPGVSIGLSYNSQAANNYLEPFGNKWQFNYATFIVLDPGKTATVRLPDGRAEEYSQDAAGNYQAPPGVHAQLSHLAANRYRLRFPNGTIYLYDIPAGSTSQQPFLVSLTDAQGHSLKFGYDRTPRLTQITDADNKITRLAYNAGGRVSSVTDPFGRVANFSYDTAGNLTRIIDMGGIATDMTYDADRYISGINYGEGWWKIYTEPSDDVTTDDPYPPPGTAMDEDYRITITGPDGRKEEYYYNGYSKHSWYVAPEDYVSYVDSSTNNLHTAKKTIYRFAEINGEGVLSQKSNPAGGTEYYYYDSAGNRSGIRDPNGHQYEFAYNANGYVTQVTLPNDQTIDLTYNAKGEDVTAILDGLGSINLQYDAKRNITRIQDRKGSITKITYNANSQVATITDPAGVVTANTYDAQRRLTAVRRGGILIGQFTYDAKGRVRTARDANGLTLTYEYDNLDRLTRVLYPDGKDTRLSWSPQRAIQLDAQTNRGGQRQQFKYDVRQNLTLEVNAEKGQYRYQYDGNGNLRFFNDSNGNTTSFEYDIDNRLVRRQYADGAAETYTYDSGGRLYSRTNARGIRTSYGYDENDNLTRISYGDSTRDVSFAYDDHDRLISRRDALGTFAYTYDANSNLTSVDGPWDSDTITYQYDKLDRRTAMNPQSGYGIVYRYDALDRMQSVQVNGRLYRLGYNGNGSVLKTLTRPSGVVTRYLNDGLLRLTEISNETAGGKVLNRFEYSYDAQDMRDSETVTNVPALAAGAANVTAYDYNQLNQLLESTRPNQTFTYDADGNLIGGYTAAGKPFVATYDAENRPTSLEYTDATGAVRKTEYVYGADSLVGIVKKYQSGSLVSEKRFLRDGFLVIQERNDTNQVERQYAWLDHSLGGIGRLLSLTLGGKTYDYLYDGKGNVAGLVNQAGALVTAYRYDTFGILKAKTGTLDQPYRFSTKYYDEETGLSDFGYRFYSAAVGRWINRDPLQESGGTNLYELANNNPINYADPQGLFDWHAGSLGAYQFFSGIYHLGSGAALVLAGGVSEATIFGIPIGISAQTLGFFKISYGALNFHKGKNNIQAALINCPLDSDKPPTLNDYNDYRQNHDEGPLHFLPSYTYKQYLKEWDARRIKRSREKGESAVPNIEINGIGMGEELIFN